MLYFINTKVNILTLCSHTYYYQILSKAKTIKQIKVLLIKWITFNLSD